MRAILCVTLAFLGGCHQLLPFLPGGARASDASRAERPPLPPLDAHAGERPLAGDLTRDVPPGCAAILCADLSLLLDFEGGAAGIFRNAVDGLGPELSSAIVQSTPGKLGGAAGFKQGGQLRFPVSYYNPAAGTVALWIKGGWDVPCDQRRQLFAITSAAETCGGPYLACQPLWNGASSGAIGIAVDDVTNKVPAAPFFDVQGLEAAWNGSKWMHLVGSWTASSTTLWGNASLYTGRGDGTTPKWQPPAAPAHVDVGGAAAAPLEAALDEVALWRRQLNKVEVDCLYQLGLQGISLRSFCKL